MAIDAKPVRASPISAESIQSENVQVTEECYGPKFDGSNRAFTLSENITGDYRVTVISLNPVGFNRRKNIFGNSSFSPGRGRVNDDGSLEFRPETTDVGGITSAIDVYPDDGLEHLIEFERIGSNGEIRFDGNTVASGAVPTGSLNLNRLGESNGSFSFGTYYDVRIFQGASLTLIHRWILAGTNEGVLVTADSVGSATLTPIGFNPGTDPDNTRQIFQCPT